MFKSEEDKIVSILFDNKQFLKDVSNTLKAIEELNEATSGKKLDSKGVEELSKSFNNLGNSAKTSLSGINKAISDDSAYQTLNANINTTITKFNLLEYTVQGIFRAIGGEVVQLGGKIARSLTSGIRDGWSEYNILMDSTQTILANTEKFGTDIGDVTKALDTLNTYADRTIYRFSDMTRNIGYFTTAGQDLETSVMAIQGMANLGAFFGATNESVSRATYQMSQAMSAGVVKLMDWKSLENASMAGKAFQEELIKTAAIMSGRTVDSFKSAIGYANGFRNTLESGWLTADVFLETLRKFAGESEEYWKSLTNANGERLYTDEEVAELMQLGETAAEAATKVRTFKMMVDSIGEAIGSGWAETFRILIGNLEQAKDFWTPINDLLAGENGVISSIGKFRNIIVQSWANIYRDAAIDDLMAGLTGIADILKAVGKGFISAFGGPRHIATQIGTVIEPLGDLVQVLVLDEEELQDIADLTKGLLSPIVLICDIIRELVRIFFNASDAMNEFDESEESLAANIKPLRKEIFDILGLIGRVMSKGLEMIKSTDGIRKGIELVGTGIKKLALVIDHVLYGAFLLIYNAWEKYDITDKIIEFCDKFVLGIMSLEGPLVNLSNMIYTWFVSLKRYIGEINFTPLTDLSNIFSALKDVAIAVVDPTMSVVDALVNLRDTVGNTSAWDAISVITDKLKGLYYCVEGMAAPTNEYTYIVVAGLTKIKDVVKKSITFVTTQFTRLANVLKSSKLSVYIDAIKDSFVSLYERLSGLNIANFILGFVDAVRESISTLIDLFASTKIGESITTFINNFRTSIAGRVNIPRPNIFTSISDVGDEITEAASKDLNLENVAGKLATIRSISTSVKETILDLKPSEALKSAAESTVFGQLIDVISPIADATTDMSHKANKIGEAFDSISSIDTEEAQRKTEQIASVIAAFVGIFKWLADSVVTFIFVLSLLNFSKWSSVIKDGFTLLGGTIGNGFTSIALAIQNSIGAVSNAVKAWADVFKENAKADMFASVADMFKTLAIFLGVVFAGVALISQFGDMDAFTSTFRQVMNSLCAVLLSIAAMVSIIILAAGSLNKVGKGVKPLGAATMLSIGAVMFVLEGLITRITILMATMSAIAIKVAELGNPDEFYRALAAMMAVFAIIITIIAVTTAAFKAMAERMHGIPTTDIFGTHAEAALMIAAISIKKIINAVGFLMVSIGLAAALMGKYMETPAMMDKFIKVITEVGKWLTIFMTVTLFLANISGPELAMTLSSVNGMLLTISATILAFAAAMGGLILVFGFVTTELTLAFTGLVAAIDNLNDITGTLEDANSIFDKIVHVVQSTLVIVTLILSVMSIISSAVGKNSVFGSISVVSIGVGILLISKSLVFIASAISEIMAVDGILNTNGNTAVRCATSIAIAFAGIMAAVMIISRVGARYGLKGIAGILAATAAILAISNSIVIITTAIGGLAAIDRLTDVDTITNSILKLVGIMSAIMLVFSLIGALVPNGMGVAGIAVAAAGIIALSYAVRIIASAMEHASLGIMMYVKAMDMLSNIDTKRISRNMQAICETIPAAVAMVTLLLPAISDMVKQIFSSIAQGIVDGIFIAFSFLSGWGAANLAGLIEIVGSIFVGVIVGVVEVIKELARDLCADDGPLWEVLEIIGPFLEDVSAWFGYYGTLMLVSLFKGMLGAIRDMGWDVIIGNALGKLAANIEVKAAEKLGMGSVADFFGVLGMTWGQALAEGFLSVMDDVIEIVLSNVRQIETLQDNFMLGGVANLVNWGGVTDNLEATQEAIQELQSYGQMGYDNAAYQTYSNALTNAQEDLDMAILLEETADEYIQARARGYEHLNENDPSSAYYDPSKYYALAAGVSNWSNEIEDSSRRSSGALGTISEAFGRVREGIGNLLGIGDGQSITSLILGDDFSLANILGLGDVGDMFGDSGANAASDWLNGYSNVMESSADSLMDNAPNINTSSWGSASPSIDEEELSKVGEALEKTSSLPDEVSNPTITPVIDDTEFRLGIDDLVSTWNNKTYDQFAIDADTSMLLRESANGDAATDGNVTYSFTQNNYSPEALSPIQLYRDGKNLVRGSGLFRSL